MKDGGYLEKLSYITGNEAAVLGAIEGDAESFFGYPITPATEILESWIKKAEENTNLNYLQTEDEIAAGFAVIGALLAGKKAFTATAGIGHVLMQDPISMAENERLPFVGIITQRGGPSTGTVIYSQQELNLASYGGNGDGLRIVYSASSVSEVYYLSQKIFSIAWKYRFPTFLLTDGYLAKQRVNSKLEKYLKPFPASKILRETKDQPTHLRNCYGSETEFANILKRNIADYKSLINKVSESESYRASDSKYLIIAHGSVASAAKDSVDILRSSNIKVGLLRPITIRPLDSRNIRRLALKAEKVFIVESAFEQFVRMIVFKVPEIANKIVKIYKPAEGFTPDEIASLVNEKI